MALWVLFHGAAGVHRCLLLSDDSEDLKRKREAVGPGQTHEAGIFKEFIWISETKMTLLWNTDIRMIGEVVLGLSLLLNVYAEAKQSEVYSFFFSKYTVVFLHLERFFIIILGVNWS